MMKRFSFPIIFGISFALVFIGYVVFAVYIGPTQAPPGGNVPVPLNVGPETQTKQGKLIISGGLDSPKVQTPQVCIGGACKTAWPAELVPGDYVALGMQRCSGGYIYCCGNAQAFVDWYCDATGYSESDPRNVLSPRGTVTKSCNCPAGPWAGQSYHVLAAPPPCSGGFQTQSSIFPSFGADIFVNAILQSIIPSSCTNCAFSAQACKQQ